MQTVLGPKALSRRSPIWSWTDLYRPLSLVYIRPRNLQGNVTRPHSIINIPHTHPLFHVVSNPTCTVYSILPFGLLSDCYIPRLRLQYHPLAERARIDQSQRVEWNALHRPVRRGAEVFIVYPLLPGVHRYDGVAGNIFDEWTGVEGMEGSSEGCCLGITEHHELVAREGLVKVKLVCGGLVADKLFVFPGEFLYHIPQRKNDAIDEFSFLVERKVRRLTSSAWRWPSSG